MEATYYCPLKRENCPNDFKCVERGAKGDTHQFHRCRYLEMSVRVSFAPSVDKKPAIERTNLYKSPFKLAR